MFFKNTRMVTAAGESISIKHDGLGEAAYKHRLWSQAAWIGTPAHANRERNLEVF